MQHALLKQLRQIVRDGALTHAEVAQRGGSSRTRVTAILNGNLNYAVSDREPRVAPNLRLVGSSDDWKRGQRDEWALHAQCRGIELDNGQRCVDVESEYVEGKRLERREEGVHGDHDDGNIRRWMV